MNEKKDLEEFYHGKGFGRKLGFGKVPAVLVMDFTKAFTDKNSPLGGDFSVELAETLQILRYASAFLGTAVSSELNAERLDTIILTGCTTSGCIRATAVDGISYEFRVIVVKEAVGDRSPLSHKVSLADIEAKYGDVVSSDSVLKYFKSLRGSLGK